MRSSGYRVKPNMAVNGGPNLRRLSLLTRSFMFTRIVKIAQGDWNRRNLEPPYPPYLASLFARSGDRKISLHIYIYGAHWGTHTDGVKATSGHVSGLVFIFSCPPNPSINHMNFYYIKQIINFPCVCTVTLLDFVSCRTFLFCDAVTSSVIYYSTHTEKYYLFIN